MSSVMSSDLDNTDKVVQLKNECEEMGIEVQSPNANLSNYVFSVPEEKVILYGLGALKGVGQAAVEEIVNERTENGEFQDLDDFCLRLGSQKVNRRCIEALIRAGAMDCFGYTRASLFQHLDKSLRFAEQRQRDDTTGQNDMFGHAAVSMKSSKVQEVPEWEEEKKLLGERETLGLYLTGHPHHTLS